MLDFDESNRRSDNNEAAVKEQFEKLGYSVKQLDRKSSSKKRRPDFLISNSSGPQMLCEVKTIASAASFLDKEDKDKRIWVSTLDEAFMLEKEYSVDVFPIQKIDERLAIAAEQRDALIADFPELEPLPFLVAIFFDPFADNFPSPYPSSFNKDVSGILTIKEDIVVPESFETFSDKEKKEFLKNAVTSGLPRKDFVLKKNKGAFRPVPEDFARLCLPDA